MLSGLASGLSHLLIATIIGTPAALAWLMASTVCGITASSAGPLIGKASSDMKAKNGVGVVHFTKAFKGAQKFEADIGGLWGTLDRKAYPNPLYVRTGEVIYSSDDFLAPPPKA